MAHDFDAFFHQFLVLLGDLIQLRGRRGLHFLLDAGVENRRALVRNEINEIGDLGISDEHALGARHARGAGREVKHVAVAEEALGALFVEDDARIEAARDLESDAARDVRFDDAGNDVRARSLRRCTIMWMPGARAFCAMRAMAFSTSAGAVCMRSASSSTMTTM